MVFRRKTGYRKPYRRPYRRRRGRYPAKRTSRTSVRIKSPSLIPDRYFCKLNYAENFSQNTTTSLFTRVYQSSLFDPRNAVGGHQPLGFDQMAALYDKYIVFGMRYDIQVYNDSSSPVDFAVVWKNVSTTTTNFELLQERPYSDLHLISGNNAGRAKQRFRGYMSVAKMHGVAKKVINTDDKFNSTVTSDPSLMLYLHLYQIAHDGATSVFLDYMVKITYYACFYDRKPISSS